MSRRSRWIVKDPGDVAELGRAFSYPFELSQFDAAFCYFQSPHGVGINDPSRFRFQGGHYVDGSIVWSDLGNGHFECPSINDVPAGGFVCVPVGVAFTAISEPYDDVRTPMKYTPGLVRVHYHTEWWRAETTIIIEGVRF
mgnify:CR=1 FL=1